ncbi:MAG: LCP family protein, partial [Lachnospiraceae bacterium]|nr:LCP family protein [Lachnospiraceae bacterium]
MSKNRKITEDEILIEERMGEEEDYKEYARMREEREGIRSRRERIALEEERRQAMEYERIRNRQAQQREEKAQNAQRSAYERRKRRKKHPIRNFFLAILLLALLLAGGTLLYLRSRLQTVNSVELEDVLQSSISMQVQQDEAMAGYQNIALFGVDSREQDLLSGDNRSDAIMVCSINKKTGKIKLVSVYRDTLLDIGGGEMRKCNAAYAFGGPQQAVAMLNRNLDLNITDFVTVGFEGLADTIDALGGIDLEITEEEMEYMNSYMDDMYYEIGTEYDEVTDYGMQHLSGIQATAYCRIRYTAGDDFKRAERQRTVLALTLQKAREANPLQLIAAANAALGKTATSLSSGELFMFILRAKGMDLTDSTGFPTEEDRI